VESKVKTWLYVIFHIRDNPVIAGAERSWTEKIVLRTDRRFQKKATLAKGITHRPLAQRFDTNQLVNT
jgi:hypothetical protein